MDCFVASLLAMTKMARLRARGRNLRHLIERPARPRRDVERIR
jgi:hypothetical protein